MLSFFGGEKAAGHIRIYLNINRRHAGGFKTDDAASVRITLFIGNIKMLAGKTIDLLNFLISFISHVAFPETVIFPKLVLNFNIKRVISKEQSD
jgi:hypothetical protein